METDLRLLGRQMLAPAVFWDVFVQGKRVFFKDEIIIRMQAGACHHPMGRNMHKAQMTHALRGITNIDVYIDLPISLIYSYISFLTLKLL